MFSAFSTNKRKQYFFFFFAILIVLFRNLFFVINVKLSIIEEIEFFIKVFCICFDIYEYIFYYTFVFFYYFY